MSRLPPPPMPAKLCELLADYPGHIGRLREILDEFSESKPRLQPYDEALWALEDALSAFVQEAVGEVRAAEEKGDASEIARAKEKERLMYLARSGNVGLGGRSLQGLWTWFQDHKGAFE